MRRLTWIFIVNFILIVTASSSNEEDDTTATEKDVKEVGEKKLSDQIRAILEHYKQEDPVGIPGAPIPDPMPIPDMTHSFSLSVGMRINKLEILGNYTMSTWFSKSQGRFNVTLSNVYVEGLAKLEVERGGQLAAQNIDMDIIFEDIAMNFENLGFMGSIFQGIINSVGSFLFDSIKPFILSEVNTNIRGDVNKHIRALPQRFPNSISPLDMAIAEGRRHVREMGYDPYYFPDYNYTVGIFRIDLTHSWASGISSFYRVGNVTVTMEGNTVYVEVHIGTMRLQGKCLWEVTVGGVLSRAGSASFSVEYIQAKVEVSQPLDTRKKPVLQDLDLKVGNIQARMDGAGTMDYVVEFLVNVLPNVLRYQIVNAIEGPLKIRVQEIMDSVDVEELIEEHLPELDKAQITL
ncbi:hypothetical protein C0J52_10472 [Blattella germanica]|nr:hypothetical protein C0J52_10472 [Blattella germanica]